MDTANAAVMPACKACKGSVWMDTTTLMQLLCLHVKSAKAWYGQMLLMQTKNECLDVEIPLMALHAFARSLAVNFQSYHQSHLSSFARWAFRI